jgi:hypothetical protein
VGARRRHRAPGLDAAVHEGAARQELEPDEERFGVIAACVSRSLTATSRRTSLISTLHAGGFEHRVGLADAGRRTEEVGRSLLLLPISSSRAPRVGMSKSAPHRRRARLQAANDNTGERRG